MKSHIFLALALIVSGCSADDRLIGGTPADPKDWPASVYASMGNARCSATVVGERVLLIASHCVSEGGKASFSVGANKYVGTCNHHPEYTRFLIGRNSTADWTLCLIDKPVAGVDYEVLNTNPLKPDKGDVLTLTGYGCIQQGGGGGNDGIFRTGQATVTAVPSGSNYDIVTKGSAALCFGDSGGAAYQVNGKDRVIVGVNSRGNIKDTSYLPAVASIRAYDWMKDWAAKKGVLICGIHALAKGCRGAVAPQPIPDLDFSATGRLGSCKGAVYPQFEPAKPELIKRLEAALNAANE